MPCFEDESLLDPALAPAEPPDDKPPAEPDEPVTDELPSAPVADDDEPSAPDDVLLEPAASEPVLDEPEPDEPPPEPLDEPLRPPLLPGPLEPMLPVAPALLVPLTLGPVDGLLLDDEPPDRLPDEPALADEPGLLLFRLLDLSSLPKLDWSLPMLLPLPCLPASTPFPSLDF